MDGFNDSSVNTIFGGSEIVAYVKDPLLDYVDTIAADIDSRI